MFNIFNTTGKFINFVIVVDIFFTAENVIYCVEIYSNGGISNEILSSEDLEQLEKDYKIKWSD